MSDYVARLKPKGHKVQTYSIEGVRFLRGKGWIGIEEALALRLRKVRQSPTDDGSPLIFDVLTRGEATQEHEQEAAAVKVPSPAEVPVVKARSSAPRADELMIDGYAGMTAKNILRKLERESFTRDELEDLRAFEMSHAKRKTVLRELDSMLAE